MNLRSGIGVRAVLAMLVLWAGLALGAPAPAVAADANVARALDYLHACQTSDGGFAEKGGATSEAVTAWAMVSIAAAGEDCNAWRVQGVSPTDYLSHQSAKWQQVTDYARTTLAVVAAGKDPRAFAGVDLVGKMQAAVTDRGNAGDQIGPLTNSHIWAMIALSAAGQRPTDREVAWLLGEQRGDGGWGWAPGIASDTNDTAAALQALAAAGQPSGSQPILRALAYLRAHQAADGGFIYSTTPAPDANSTAWVAQGLAAVGQLDAGWRVAGGTPRGWLVAKQGADGSERYSAAHGTTPLLVTVQAIPALLGKAFPVAHPTAAGAVSSWQPTVVASWPAAGARVAWPSGTTLRLTLADAGTGISAAGVSAKVDGVAARVVVSGSALTVSATLAPGAHHAVVTVVDRAGNPAAQCADWRFTVAAAGESVSPSAASAGATAAAGNAAAANPGAPVVPATVSATQTGSSVATDGAAAAPLAGAAGVAAAQLAAGTPGRSAGVGLIVAAVALVVALAAAAALVLARRRFQR